MEKLYSIIWLDATWDEMKEGPFNEKDRNLKLQELADTGFSPVWRDYDE